MLLEISDDNMKNMKQFYTYGQVFSIFIRHIAKIERTNISFRFENNLHKKIIQVENQKLIQGIENVGV